MNSKDALEILNIAWSGRKDKDGYPNFDDIHMALYTLDKNLERLEKFAHENASLHTEIDSLHTENEKLKKAFNILKGKIWLHNGYVCYAAYADIKLTDEEFKLLKEYL